MYTPWAKDEEAKWQRLDFHALVSAMSEEPPGVITRQGMVLFTPISIPSLIGLKDMKYLDKTGLMRNNGLEM